MDSKPELRIRIRALRDGLAENEHQLGVGFESQLVDHVPEDPHDIPVDWLCPERRKRDLRGYEKN